MPSPTSRRSEEWAQSPEYLKISEDRQVGADTVTLLVKGLGHRS
ncbi:hypothetical protein [Nocardia sp. NBC_00403]